MSIPAAVQYLKTTRSRASSSNREVATTLKSRIILVLGATGKQGGATITQLCALPGSRDELHIIAVTRNPESDAAIALKRKHPQIELYRGDLDDIADLFDSLPGTPEALFSVQPALGKGYVPLKEIQQGQKLHEAAIDVGVKHIVYTSIDRHGSESDTTSTKVPHFDSKWEIEQHLTAECARSSSNTTWTILRPVAFFDNLTPDLAGRVAAAAIGRCRKPQQMIAVRDVGWFAARALTGYVDPPSTSASSHSKSSSSVSTRSTNGPSDTSSGSGFRRPSAPPPLNLASSNGKSIEHQPPANPYAYRKLSLAGDEIDLPSMRERFYEKMGYSLPEAYGWMGGGALWMSRELTAMNNWLGRVGYGANVNECRLEHPDLLKFSQWVERESGFTRGAEVMGNWLS